MRFFGCLLFLSLFTNTILAQVALNDTLNKYDSNGVKQGLWKENANNTEYCDYILINYKDNIPTGAVKGFYNNGSIAFKGTYDNGVLTGEWKFYYKSGQLKLIGEKVKNLDEGRWLIYSENGEIAKEIFYKEGVVIKEKNNFNNEIYGYDIRLTIDYNVPLPPPVVFDEDSLLIKYFSGEIAWKAYYKDKVMIDKLTLYYKDGKKWMENTFEKGLKEGEFMQWNEEGQVIKKCSFVNNELSGVYLKYHNNGNPKVEAFYKSGIEQGVHKEYFESGKLHIEYEVKDGKAHGYWKGYYESGQLWAAGKMQNGEKIEEFKEYTSEGELITKDEK